MAGRNEVGITLTAKDLASREIGKVGGALEHVGSAAQTTEHKSNILARTFVGLANGVFLGAGMFAFGQVQRAFGFMTGSVVGMNNQLQNASIGFATMLGSGEKAQKFLDALQAFAAKTPFEFSELVPAAQRMLAMGFAAKDVIPDLTAVGDAAAALGASPETIDRVTLALGQMNAKGKVSAEEMLQLTEAGIPAWDLLAKGMGKSTAEVMKLSEKGLIPAKKAIDLITKGMEDRFGGMMDKASHTYSGAMSTIHDVTQNVLATAFHPLFDRIAKGADQLATFLTTSNVQGWANDFATGFGRVLDVLTTFFGKIVAFVSPIKSLIENLTGIGHAAVDINVALQQLHDAFANLFGTGGGSILTTVMALRQRLYDALAGIFDRILTEAPIVINKLTAALPGFLSKVFPVLLKFARQAADQTMAFVGQLITSLYDHREELISAVSNFFQAAFDWVINTGVPMAAQAIAAFIPVFLDWVFEMLPKLLDTLDAVVAAIVDFIIKNAPVLAGKLVEWAIAFVGFIATEVVPRLIANLPTILRVILAFLATGGLKLVNKMGDVGFQMVMKLVDWLLKMPGETASKLALVLLKVLGWADHMISGAKNAARGFVNGVINFIKDLPFKVAGHLLDVIAGVLSFGGKLAIDGEHAASGFVGKVVSVIGGLPAKVAGFLGSILSGILGWGSTLITDAGKAAEHFVSGFIDGLSGLPKLIARNVRQAFKSLKIDLGPFHISASGVHIDLPKIDLPKFASGAWKLPSDMVAQVHAGEMIIPADIAARLRGETGAVSTNLPATAFASASATGGPVNVVIQNYYGPSSVRSSEDIRRISEEQAERMRLMGFTPTVRTTGTIG